eukprot:GEMP01095759.1.p1 GENE.GEMP01095759.1~~GEMP01095759.1.p1  ORF type:complete len:196 (+),score=21.21 GEMP01095759.1:154-741(+)
MGYLVTSKFITNGARSRGQRVFYRKFGPNHRQWAMMKEMLNELIMKQRYYTTLPRAKELQQYAEEIIFLAKREDARSASLVESMLTSAPARQILYEKLVPRYKDRHFFFTRVVNQWQIRERDSGLVGFLEYVDRPGELTPANPVGEDRKQFVASQFEANRRNRRRYGSEAIKLGLVSADNPSKMLPEAKEIYLEP